MIVSSVGNCQIHLYADDTIMYCAADCVELVFNNLQFSFNVLQNAFKLVLNKKKNLNVCYFPKPEILISVHNSC